MFEWMHSDEYFTRLMQWESLGLASDGQIVEREQRTQQLRDFVELFRFGGKRDDAAQLLLTCMGAAVFARAFPQIAEMITGQAVDEASFLTKRKRHLKRLSGLIEESGPKHGK